MEKTPIEPFERMSPKEKAKKLARHLRKEYPDYTYLREVFRYLRKELKVEVTQMYPQKEKVLVIPTEAEIKRYYEAVWRTRDIKHVILIKTLLYTGMRVSELIGLKAEHIDFEKCQIRIPQRSNKKERFVPFPYSFKEILAMYTENIKKKGSKYLFESTWKRPYTDRGIRRILAIYTKKAGMEKSISPRKLRHFLFMWMKKQGIEGAFIQPFSGHRTPESLDIYGHVSPEDGHKAYDDVIDKFPV